MSTKRYFERLMDLARVELPGASDAGLRLQMFEVLSEFFNYSSAWFEDITLPVIAGTVTYDLRPLVLEKGGIVRLAGVMDANSVPQAAMMRTPGILSLRNPPNTNQTFTVAVIKNVVLPEGRDGLPDVPSWAFELYLLGFVDGVLAKMMGQPTKPYYDSANAVYHMKRFRLVISEARVAALRRNTFGLNSWVYPQQFRTRSQKGGVSVGSATEF